VGFLVRFGAGYKIENQLILQVAALGFYQFLAGPKL
jgi:hypothetical protein